MELYIKRISSADRRCRQQYKEKALTSAATLIGAGNPNTLKGLSRL